MAKNNIKTKILRSKRGVSLTGYGLLLGLIAVIGIASIQNIGGGVTSLFEKVGNRLTSASDGSGGTGSGGSTPTPNAQPSFIPSSDPQTIIIAAGTQTISSFAIFNQGTGDTGQSVQDYIITELADMENSVSSVDIDNNGDLTLITDIIGSETIRVQVQDDGGTSNGGIDTSIAVDFIITVIPVPNAKPSATLANNPLEVLFNGSSQNINSFSVFDQGTGDSGQAVLDYIITPQNDLDNSISSIDIDNSGNLSFTTSSIGSETIRIEVQDDGGTVNGGIDTSDPIDLVINVTAADCSAFGAGVHTIDPDGAGTGVSAFDVECDASGYIMLTVDSGGDAFFYNKNAFGFDGTTRCLNADTTPIPSYYAQFSTLPSPDFDHNNLNSGTDSSHTHNITYRRPGSGSNYTNAQIEALNTQISEYASGIEQLAHTCDEDGFDPNHEVRIISATGSSIFLMTQGFGDPAGTNAYITDWIYTHNTATVADQVSPIPSIPTFSSQFLIPVQVRFTQRGSGMPNNDYFYGGMAWGFNQQTIRVR